MNLKKVHILEQMFPNWWISKNVPDFLDLKKSSWIWKKKSQIWINVHESIDFQKTSRIWKLESGIWINVHEYVDLKKVQEFKKKNSYELWETSQISKMLQIENLEKKMN